MAKNAQLLRADGGHWKYLSAGEIWNLIGDGWASLISHAPLVARLNTRRETPAAYQHFRESRAALTLTDMHIFATGSLPDGSYVSRERIEYVASRVSAWNPQCSPQSA